MLSKHHIYRWMGLAVTFVLLAQTASARIIYVDDSSAGLNDGTSWENALTNLKDALIAAHAGDEIRVAQGTYAPTFPNGDRDETFALSEACGATIKGGYAGFGETHPDSRDVSLYETTLTGDLNGDDEDDFRNNDENCFHVVTSSGTDKATVLDGFTITGGNANDVSPREKNGGGLFNDGGRLTVVDCNIVANAAASDGAGVFIEADAPTFERCRFASNSAKFGGGVFSAESEPTFIQCLFVNNEATHGGGMYNSQSRPRLIGCAFFGNLGSYGGAVSNYASDPNLTNNIFSGNSAAWGGGMFSYKGKPVLTNCTFSRNSADCGGGFFGIDAEPVLLNSILWGNWDASGMGESAQIHVVNGIPMVRYSCLQGWSGTGAGTGNHGNDPQFANPAGVDGIIGTQDDDLRLLVGSPCMDAGTNAGLPPWVTVDFAGNPRICDGIVDQGALETCGMIDTSQVLYVDADAPRPHDGKSWATALTQLQAALDLAAKRPEVQEIRVASGTYTPGDPNGPRDATFRLVSNVTVKGGYAGWGRSDPNNPDSVLDPDTRNLHYYETVLSGDLNDNDIPVSDPCELLTDLSRSDNCYHVVTASVVERTAVLEGFTITGGIANGRHDEDGGGIYIVIGDPNLTQCRFHANAALGGGGGIYCLFGSAIIQNCEVEENFALAGAGVYCFASSPEITGNSITENVSVGGGAGICCDFESSPVIASNTISGNRSNEHGGGLCCLTGSQPEVTCNLIKENAAYDGGGLYCHSSRPTIIYNIVAKNVSFDDGGGMSFVEGSNAVVQNNTIVGNYANPQGGGIFCENSTVTITNCIIWDNGDNLRMIAEVRSGSSNDLPGSTCEVTHSCIQGGLPELSEQGADNISYYPYFVDAESGDYRLRSYSPCIGMGRYEISPAADTDQDGLPDDWEIEHFGDLQAEPEDDLDIDGYSNLREYHLGTDPHVVLPELVHVSVANEGDLLADGSRQHPFSSIQQAIEKVRDGGDIWISRGTFHENLVIDGKVVHMEGGYSHDFARIRGLTVLDAGRQGRAILYRNTPDGTLTRFHITGGFDRDGAGLYLLSSSPRITGNLITGNIAEDDGGAISCYFQSKPVLENNTIADNVAYDNGGGIYCRDASPRIRDCTISGNEAEDGGGMRLRRSSPEIIDCTFVGNTARDDGGAIECKWDSQPIISNCTISRNVAAGNGGGIAIVQEPSAEGFSITISDSSIHGNTPHGLWANGGAIYIEGTVQTSSDVWMMKDLSLTGPGTLKTDADTLLKMDDCTLACDVAGPGIVAVELESELRIENATELDGVRMECAGLLQVKDRATIRNAHITVMRSRFEDGSIVSNSVIIAEAGTPFGQFFAEDTAMIYDNEIHADGDRYMDLDPEVFDGVVANNLIYVTVTEGVGRSRGGLLELRGAPDLCTGPIPDDPNNPFLIQVEQVPASDETSWTIEELRLVDGAKVNLTNRFDFQPPFDEDGDNEALYVRTLVLGEGSTLNTAFNYIYYENCLIDPNATVKNIPLLGFSLNNIAFDDEEEFVLRVKSNNYLEELDSGEQIGYTYVQRVEGWPLDPNGVMRLCNSVGLSPDNKESKQLVHARAKGLFAKSNESEILITFEYLFETQDPAVELIVYLVDCTELLRYDDPNRPRHYVEVARLLPPPAGRPGSAGSERFGVFSMCVNREHLDFMRGTYVELEVVGPANTCVVINNWDPQVHCNDLYCGDVTGDFGANILDLLTVIAYVGSEAALHPDNATSLRCLEFAFSEDGRVDTLDVEAWALRLAHENPLSLCEIPMFSPDTLVSGVGFQENLSPVAKQATTSHINQDLDALLIGGKGAPVRSAEGSYVMSDAACVFDRDGRYLRNLNRELNLQDSNLKLSQCNGKLIKDRAGSVYQVNHLRGLVRVNDDDVNAVVVPPAVMPIASHPRSNTPGVVAVGLRSVADQWVGRPILDAAFDAEGHVYVAPVVVAPDAGLPYTAVAKLALTNREISTDEKTPYELVQLYAHVPWPNDNQDSGSIREIELSTSGILYVLNANGLNESDILWAFDVESDQQEPYRLDLGKAGSSTYLPAPTAMHVSELTGDIYLASSLGAPNASSAMVYRLASDWSDLKKVEVAGMGHITSIAEDIETETIWVLGFTMSGIPTDYIDGPHDRFYQPYLARLPLSLEGIDTVEAESLSCPEGLLALPSSIVWTEDSFSDLEASAQTVTSSQ